MNIMLVSVCVRTKEIGLRLAVGARARDVLVQFLVEALVLCVSGGLLGAMIAAVAVEVLGGALDIPMTVSIQALGAALLVSVTIGVLFGLLPAKKAAGLDPIVALSTE
jgi:ABC-type antimicrobial peptide transport system permease subunit